MIYKEFGLEKRGTKPSIFEFKRVSRSSAKRVDHKIIYVRNETGPHRPIGS